MQTHAIESMQQNKKHIAIGILICTVGALFYCYEFLLRILPGALQGELSQAFGHISATAFGQLAAFYYFAYSPMQLPVGMLIDHYGPRRLLIFACFCCTLGSWMFSITSSIFIASCGRFLVGFGSSFAFVGALTLTMHWLPRKFFSLVVGLVTTLGMLGLVYGEVKITDIAVSLGLYSILNATIIGGLLLTLLIFIVVRDNPEKHIVPRYTATEFFTNVWAVLISPKVWLIGFIGACLYTSLSVFGELWGKIYLEQAHHLTKVEAARAIATMFLGWAIGAPLVGYLSDKSGKRVLPLALASSIALVCISLILYSSSLSYVWLNILLLLYGISSGTEIIVFVMGKESSGAQLSGTVFAAINMIVTLGGVIFQPLVGKILDSFGDSIIIAGEHIYTVRDYQFALSILPISLLAVIILTFFIKDPKSTSLSVKNSS